MKLFALLLCLTLPALARIGETVDQCKARYGGGTKIGDSESLYAFVKNSFDITAHFDSNGKCDMIEFSPMKLTGIFSREPRAMTPEERAEICIASGMSGNIRSVESDAGFIFTSDETTTKAFLTIERTSLKVFTPSGDEWFMKGRKTSTRGF